MRIAPRALCVFRGESGATCHGPAARKVAAGSIAPMATTGEGRSEHVVIGAGLAGLRCAERLTARGDRVRLIEAQDAVGGRARTVWHEGVPVDRGFQTVFAGYPETRRFLRSVGLPRADLRAFGRGFQVHDGFSWRQFALGNVLRSRPVGMSDLGRMAQLGAEARARSPESQLAPGLGAESALAFLVRRGFSDRAIDLVFRPLFAPILLDRELGADSGYFRFLLSALARGPAVIPSDGVGMLAEWALATIIARGAVVETGVRATSLALDAGGRRVTGVRLADGREIAARAVVLAVDAPAARSLLEPIDPGLADRLPSALTGCVTAAYLLDAPLYRGRTLLLNGASAGVGPRVDLVCQTTNVTRPTGTGPHVVLALSITGEDAPPDHGDLDAAVAATMRRWAPRFAWRRQARLVEVFEHRFAQFRSLPGVRDALPGPASGRLANLVLAGDLTAHSSIEGAVSSGTAAAAAVASL